MELVRVRSTPKMVTGDEEPLRIRSAAWWGVAWFSKKDKKLVRIDEGVVHSDAACNASV